MPHPSFLRISGMPGPAVVAALQLEQAIVCEGLRARDHETPGCQREADPVYRNLQARYEASVQALEAALGPHAHCNQVDRQLWSALSKLHKLTHGFWPHGHHTRLEAKQHLAHLAEISANWQTDEAVDDGVTC